jgi:hypothetical protein
MRVGKCVVGGRLGITASSTTTLGLTVTMGQESVLSSNRLLTRLPVDREVGGDEERLF